MKRDKRCFKACSKQKVENGLCDCLSCFKIKEPNRFKVLMYANRFISPQNLNYGLYETSTPPTYPIDSTLEGLIKVARDFMDINGQKLVSHSHIENLKKCQLITVELKIVEE